MSENVTTVFPKKWRVKLPEGFEKTAESLSTEEAKARLIEYEREISSTEKDMESDEKLKDLKEMVKELNGGYRDVINTHKAMIKYLIYVMEGRGAL